MSAERRGAPPPPADETFIGRWSRRKRSGVGDESAADAAGGAPAVSPEFPPAELAAPADAGDEPVLTDADMPPIETLDESSDFSGFLSPGVSEGLRKAALRRLFHLPQFNVRDGLNDYDEDFTYFEPLGDTVTADMRHQREVERERERLRAEAQAAEGERAASADDDPGESDAAEPGSDAAPQDPAGRPHPEVEGVADPSRESDAGGDEDQAAARGAHVEQRG